MNSRYKDQGLVLIGVHTTKGSDKMAEFAKDVGIDYPIAIDINKQTITSFAVDSYPDYYVIDRKGNLRFADLGNADLERAIKMLLEEGDGVPIALAAASETAIKKDKRILVMWGSKDERATMKSLTKGDLRQFVSYEYEVVGLQRADEEELAEAHEAGASGPVLAVLDAKGKRLARLDARDLDEAKLAAFLKQNAVPQKNAEKTLAKALTEARRSNRRVLVHIGAPW